RRRVQFSTNYRWQISFTSLLRHRNRLGPRTQSTAKEVEIHASRLVVCNLGQKWMERRANLSNAGPDACPICYWSIEFQRTKSGVRWPLRDRSPTAPDKSKRLLPGFRFFGTR